MVLVLLVAHLGKQKDLMNEPQKEAQKYGNDDHEPKWNTVRRTADTRRSIPDFSSGTDRINADSYKVSFDATITILSHT